MSEPVYTEEVERDESKSYRDQADEIAQQIQKDHGINVFGTDQTHYVNTSIGDDGEIKVSVHEVES